MSSFNGLPFPNLHDRLTGGAARVHVPRVYLAAVLLLLSALCCAQNASERTFSAPVAVVQAALRKLPGGTSGPLPVLDGFALSNGRSFQTYERPYYQCTIHVTSTASVNSVVRVTAKITAWNTAISKYELLKSNGRIEADLLDRLQEALPPASNTTALVTESRAATPDPKSPTPEISAPVPQLPSLSTMKVSPAVRENGALEQEAKGLEDLLRNQSHPTDLIAVKQDQTPVLEEPSSDGKVLFLASAEDEFEILDINPEWVHVRISGLSRGWLRRATVEILDGSGSFIQEPSMSAIGQPSRITASQSNKLFSVSGEEAGSFPGDWAPLKGKSVKIVSIQQAAGTGVISSPQEKMQFAENLFRTEEVERSDAGLVLIFDAEDGGMIAATRSIIDLWRTGALSEQAFWKQCYLDPPEILGAAN